ncbi:ArsA family ATPase [Natronobacterium gregoryi]|uniref:ATPase n=2 Tax=Natronobacterium gregoryi TaxID=44930 RepID=L0AML3_NATGS|nr:TRC40/GET3/ArsA family transport-energizing ATPase [Natronobacterium gregoryi]AFZ74694.1 arsenite-activated ATPase ArsA [Natronobacterium gregoryi SP2]ELY73401.1 arsenite-activated ATPase ArsA [Natronobacterium gregoryi SP2]PLK20939.1 ATPase [Natronobacterium gregoryi SP2]SFJ04678.1 arsenite efflux ATP-binding protein ArsA [Natronobacterium gregoryi]
MTEFVFFGGKGGVGKTTVSSAHALQCVEGGLEALVVSTDPAHSTADVFDQEFGDEPKPVEGYEGLSAMEIDPDQEVQDHLLNLKRQLNSQLSATMVNEVDIQLEMAHQTPGAYEAALFDRFVDVMRNANPYDRVVFDTSPTGATLRLLALPDLLEQWIDRLMAKRRRSIDLYEKAAIGNREPRRVMDGDPVLARLRERKERFEFAGEVLRDDASFYLVLNPDQLSIRETERSIETLSEADLPVRGLVVNRLTPEPDPDEEGRGARYLRTRVETERDRLEHIEREFDVPVVATIETRTEEVRGRLLEDVANELEIALEPAGSPSATSG